MSEHASKRRCRGNAAGAAVGIFVAALAAAAPLGAEPTCQLNPKGLTICIGRYALCDKSNCKTVAGNARCTCPILDGASIASLDQLGGSCTPPKKGTVYSLFSLQGYGTSGTLTCPQGTQFAQCWNATCEVLPGGKQATCTCPLCPGPFVTPGGSCNPANCKSEILVGAAFPVKGGACIGN